jgi:hypothetical protein
VENIWNYERGNAKSMEKMHNKEPDNLYSVTYGDRIIK